MAARSPERPPEGAIHPRGGGAEGPAEELDIRPPLGARVMDSIVGTRGSRVLELVPAYARSSSCLSLASSIADLRAETVTASRMIRAAISLVTPKLPDVAMAARCGMLGKASVNEGPTRFVGRVDLTPHPPNPKKAIGG